MLGLTVVIRFILAGILDHAVSATPLLQHHLWEFSAFSHQTGYRKRLRGIQSLIRRYAALSPSMSASRTDGLDMVTQPDNLGKRRLQLRKRKLLIDEKYQHCSYPPCRVGPLDTSVSTDNRTKHSNQNLKFSSKSQTSPHDTLSSTQTSSSSEIGTTVRYVVGTMPRPGQSGALLFDGNGISDFLKEWDMECEEYGLTEAQKCRKLPRYCSKDIGEAIESLNGYINGDWTEFQRELKRLFWRTDPPKETKAALFKLIGDARAGKMTVEMYVLKYTAITKVLVNRNALSKFHRNVWILEGFSDDIRLEVFECGYEQGWRMLVDDTGMEDPEFEEVKSLVLQKARGAEMEKLFQREMSESSTTFMTSSTVSTAPAPTAAPTTILSSISTASDSLRLGKVSEQISKLALLLEDQSKFQSARASTPVSKRQRQWRCFWCDSLEHARQDCSEFKEALENGLIGFNGNGNGKVTVVATGEELRLMTGRGGMKEAFNSMTAAATATVSSAATSPEDDRAAFGHLVPENKKRKGSAKTALKAVGVRR